MENSKSELDHVLGGRGRKSGCFPLFYFSFSPWNIVIQVMQWHLERRCEICPRPSSDSSFPWQALLTLGTNKNVISISHSQEKFNFFIISWSSSSCSFLQGLPYSDIILACPWSTCTSLLGGSLANQQPVKVLRFRNALICCSVLGLFIFFGGTLEMLYLS